MKEGEGEEGIVACKYTQIVGKGVQKVLKSKLSVAIKLEDTIPHGSIHTDYFKYETSIVGCI